MRFLKDSLLRGEPSPPVGPLEATPAHKLGPEDLYPGSETPDEPSPLAGAKPATAEAAAPASVPIWDLEPSDDAAPADDAPEQVSVSDMARAAMAEMRAPAAPGAGQTGGRVKTRLLGFHPGVGETDVFAQSAGPAAEAPRAFPVGWLVVTGGAGRGQHFALYDGVSTIGRGADQTVRLDFGDTAISRENHAAVAYDAEQNGFFVGHGGKANLVRLNGRPVLSTEDLSDGDELRIGQTTLRFTALCGPSFSWDTAGDEAAGG